jgi:hypothetical protein
MSRSLTYLRWGFLGIAFTASMGFGVSQAFGNDLYEEIGYACDTGDPGRHSYCIGVCYEWGYMRGRCGDTGYCQCRLLAE